MNADENNPADHPGAPSDQSQDQVRGRIGYLYKQYQFLETLVALTISALILLSLGVNLFLFKQMRLTRGQLAQQRTLATALLDEFHNKREPAIQSFISKLEGFSATNPDFKPILDKYRPYLGKYLTGTASAPAPAAAPEPSLTPPVEVGNTN